MTIRFFGRKIEIQLIKQGRSLHSFNVSVDSDIDRHLTDMGSALIKGDAVISYKPFRSPDYKTPEERAAIEAEKIAKAEAERLAKLEAENVAEIEASADPAVIASDEDSSDGES